MKAVRKGSGKQFTVVAVSAIAAGDIVIAGSLHGVAPYAIAAGATGVVEREGLFEAEYDGAAAANKGAAAYWDASAKKVTATSTDNTAIGYFAEAAVSSGTSCKIILA
ncbi:MAG: DUF2190 family protein [Lentisphaeria bacterium]|nr:DUF2190 family protein [Lentisphaeria bacterium]